MLVNRAASRRRPQPLFDALAMKGMATAACQHRELVSRCHVSETDGARIILIIFVADHSKTRRATQHRFAHLPELLLREGPAGTGRCGEERKQLVVFWLNFPCL